MSKPTHEISPRSGRPQVAQRFIAGMRRHFLDQVRAADGRNRSQLGVREISAARSTGVSSVSCRVPSTEVLDYCRLSAMRTLITI